MNKNNFDNELGKTVESYKEVVNSKGLIDWKPIYLKQTPREVIDMMNAQFEHWKTTTQIEYNEQGFKI